MGVPMGGSHVRGRYDHPLATFQLEKTLPLMVQRHAALADGHFRLSRDSRYLSVRFRRNATLYLFPILA